MAKFGQRVVALLLSALLLVSVLPLEAAKADDSTKTIEGLVIWGTSGVSRMYGDLYGAAFGEGNTSSSLGMYDAMQHEWASYHSSLKTFEDTPVSPLGGDYGYLNLGKFSNYTVADAPDYAILRNAYDGWSGSNASDLRVSKGQTSYYASQTVGSAGWREGAIKSLRESITHGVLGSGSHISDPMNWDIDKTAVVIWAGEDWVVRNQDSSDEPLPSSKANAQHLQWYWMGLGTEPVGEDYYKYYDHYFDPCPGSNGIDKPGDVLHQHVDGGVAEVARVVPLATIDGSHYGSGGEAVKECEHENQENCNRLNDVDHIYSSGNAGSAGTMHHSLVFYNSYMIRDFLFSDWQEDGNPGVNDEPHMDLDSGFGYNYEEDGITSIPDHVLSEISDRLPGPPNDTDMKLATQAGICFGRVLSGYGYSVEYLQQDVLGSQNADGSYSYTGASTSVMTDESGAVVYQTEKDPDTGETLYEPELGPNGTPLYLTKSGEYAEVGDVPADQFETDGNGKFIQKDKKDPFASETPVDKYILQDGKRIPVYLKEDGSETTDPSEAAQQEQKKVATDAAGKPKYKDGKPVYLTASGAETTNPDEATTETVPVRQKTVDDRIPIYKLDENGEKIPEEGVSVDRYQSQEIWCCKYWPAVWVGVTESSWTESGASWDPDRYEGDEQDHHYDTDTPSRRFALDGYYWNEDTEDWDGQRVDTSDRYGRGPEVLASTDRGPDTQIITHIRERWVGTDIAEKTETFSKDDNGKVYKARNFYASEEDAAAYANPRTKAASAGTYIVRKITTSDVAAKTGYKITSGYDWDYMVYNSIKGTYRYPGKGTAVAGTSNLRKLYLYAGEIIYFRFSGTATVKTEVDVYAREIAFESYTPAWYEWYKVNIPIHERCDYDLKADTGYADSWHTHQYGGIGGFVDGFPVDPEVDTQDEAQDGRVHIMPTEKIDHRGEYGSNRGDQLFDVVITLGENDPAMRELYGVWHEETVGSQGAGYVYDYLDDATVAAIQADDMDTSTLTPTGGASDHGDDFTEVQTWFTNPDKPIMRAQSEARTVRGYIDYLKDWFGKEAWDDYYSEKKGTLKFYVFGLGAYNKAYYEDQRDEIWTDGETAPDSNNTGTAVMNGFGPAAKYKELGGRIDEIARTDRIENSRQLFSKTLRSYLRGATYIDLYDQTAQSRPYFRYQRLWSSAYRHEEDREINAQHGKWYDENTYIWVFNLIWNTILLDNPRDAWGDPIAASFYSASSALATYANGIVSVRGRNTGEDESATDLHKLTELTQSSGNRTNAGNAGSAMGYGDESYDFKEAYTAYDSATSSVIDYAGILGLENQSGSLSDKSGMYLYAQYGRLLSDLGIDEVDEEHPVSPRTLPGLLMSGVYIGNSSLNVIWTTAIDLLRMLNPFSFLAQATQIANSAEAVKFTGSTTDDYANHWLVDMAASNDGLRKILHSVGSIYDALAGNGAATNVTMSDPFTGGSHTQSVNFSIVILYVALFIGGALLFYNQYKNNGKFWSKGKVLLIRIVFICIGVPLIANTYTAVLDGLSKEMSVTGSPASQMISATVVDFGGWVRSSRLAPPSGTTFVIDINGKPDNGHASPDSVSSLRKTAWAINNSTGIFEIDGVPTVAMSRFSNSDLTDPDGGWGNKTYVEYNPQNPVLVEGWNKNTSTISQVWAALKSWTNGSYYYSTNFESESLAMFASEHADQVGNIPKAGETSEDAMSGSSNTLFELFNESTVEKWDARTLDEATDILSGSKWEDFSIYTNGGLKTTISGSMNLSGGTAHVKYQKGAVSGATGQKAGLDLTAKTGGLSSLSMYNYLSSNFTESGVYVYSSAKAPSGYTSKAHYRINVIGSGIMEVLFFLNCFLFIFAAVIIGFAYSFKMVISVVKQGFQTLVSIPMAMLGVMKSIARVAVCFIAMILEIFVSMIMYGAVCEFLMIINTVLEGPLSTIMSNLTAFGAVSQPVAMSGAAYVLHLAVMTVFLGVFGFVSYVVAPKFLRVWNKVVELTFIAILGYIPEKKAVRAVSPKPVQAKSVGSYVYDLIM